MWWAKILLICGLMTGSGFSQSTQGIYNLLQRRMPQHADSFQFSLVNATGVASDDGGQPFDHYVVSTLSNGTVLVEGNSLSALSSGLHRYLADMAQVDLWWFVGNRLDVAPEQLPPLQQPIEGSSVVKWRYHFNTVTFGYLAAFWSWEDWEYQLDWMALRGINLPLAWVGFEKVLVEVFQEIGLTDAEISAFLSGPAFQPWNRLGNIQGSWCGELPESWIESQFELQQQIVARMLELGMTPVLPGFAGFVPSAITRVLPNASVIQGSQWEGFPSTYTRDTFLEPQDENFADLQYRLISKQQDYYGNVTHIYALDQYNENDPSNSTTAYLREVSNMTMQSLKAADPCAIWLMQGWLFLDNTFWNPSNTKAYLSGVENEDMIILDLFAESQPVWKDTDSFYGKPWIWCQVHDYGGNMGLYGQIMNITVNATEALAESSSLMGFGHTMESQEGNEIVYDLLLDQAWSETPIDTAQYFHDWVTVRYSGSQQPLPRQLYKAWEILRASVYNNTNLTSNSVPKSILELEPNISGLTARTGHHPTTINYNPEVIVQALQLMRKGGASDTSLWNNPAFQYDTVFLSRQILANAFIPQYNDLISIYSVENYSKTAINTTGQVLIDLLWGLESVLATNENFNLSAWIGRAVSWAQGNASLARFYEYNARNQITLWGPMGEVSDYASKQWSGLVSSYYVPRWQIFVGYLYNVTPQNFDPSELHQSLQNFELQWQQQSECLKDGGPETDLQNVLESLQKQWPDIFRSTTITTNRLGPISSFLRYPKTSIHQILLSFESFAL
ncbi:alpha-N-acetylglucosaminidase [Aspergillus udagawae]|uniref:Alpha-N-acetylglucosaminidase n=1 Tax=Aspergillus udagawae TaxID=91492 RepID=A0ABQ1B5A2_9EURO|nr:alpha-N-acetylglucosaminidase [Aspergillus udagawae]